MISTDSNRTLINQRMRRLQRIGYSFITSLFLRGLGFVITLITVPLALNQLGAERFSIWVNLSAIAALMAFADLGIGNGLVNLLAEANGKDDKNAAQRGVMNALFMLTGIALLFGVSFMVIYPFFPFERVFNVVSPQAVAEAKPAAAVFIIIFIVGLPLGIVQKVQMAYQELYLDNLWTIAGRLLSLIGLLVAFHTNQPLPILVLALVGIPLLTTTCNAVQLFGFRRRWLLTRYIRPDRATIQALIRLGFLYFILQTAAAIGFSIDSLVIAQVISADIVPQYSVPAQLFKLTGTLFSIVFLALWPAFGEAIARRDVAWVRTTFYHSLAVTFVISTLGGGLLFVIGQPLVTVWSGGQVIPTADLLAVLAIWSVLNNTGNIVASLLNSMRVIRLQVVAAVSMVIVNFTLSILLTRSFGIVGVVWGSIIAYTLCALVPYMIFVPRLIRRLDTKS